MGASVQLVPDVNVEMVQLASRIAAHLHQNPHDQQARDDLKYVVAQMGGRSGTATQANAEDAAQAKEGGNLGVLGTTVQRAGNAMSFGLGDVVGRALEGPQYQRIVDESARRNPVSNIVGTVAGGAVPFMLGGAGTLAARTAIGAAEGFGIGNGTMGQRIAGAALGAGGAAVAPAVLRAAGGVVRGTLGRVMGRVVPSILARGAPAAVEEVASEAPAITRAVTPMRKAFTQYDFREAENAAGGVLPPRAAPRILAAAPSRPAVFAPVGEAQNPGLALHDVAGNPIPGTELPGPRITPTSTPNPVREAARNAYHAAETAAPGTGKDAARRAASTAQQVVDATPAVESDVMGQLQSSSGQFARALELLSGDPTRARMTILQQVAAKLAPGEYEALLSRVNANSAWHRALTR